MELQDALKFVRIDNTFYNALQEYKRTGNTAIVLEKAKEQLFMDYKAIGILTKEFSNKESVEFFVGEKNEDVFLNFLKRCQKESSHYNLANFMTKVVFESKYADSRIASIIKEMKNVKDNSRNVYRVDDKAKNMAGLVYNSLLMHLSKMIEKDELKIKNPQLKWLELVRYDVSDNTQLLIVKQLISLFNELSSDMQKNRSKIIAIRDFIKPKLIEEIQPLLDEDTNFDIVQMFDSMTKNIVDYDPAVYGDRKRNFAHRELYNILTILYKKNVPDRVFDLVFKEDLKGGIPALRAGSIDRDDDYTHLRNSIHLFQEREAAVEYIRNAFNESLEFIPYYKEVHPILASIDRAGKNSSQLKEEMRELSRSFKESTYDRRERTGIMFQFKYEYPLKIRDENLIEVFGRHFGDSVQEHLKDIAALDCRFIDDVVKYYDDVNLAANLIHFTKKNRVSEYKTQDGWLDFVEVLLREQDFAGISELRKHELYSVFFKNRPLLNYKRLSEFSISEIDGINEGVTDIAKQYKAYDKGAFDYLMDREMWHADYELARSVFLKYYNMKDLKQLPMLAAKYFVDNKKEFEYITGLIPEMPGDVLRQLIISCEGFMNDVIEELVELVSGSKEEVLYLLNTVLEKHPSLVNVVKDYPYEDSEIRDEAFNKVLLYVETAKDPMQLPFNNTNISEDKRKEALSILGEALEEVFLSEGKNKKTAVKKTAKTKGLKI